MSSNSLIALASLLTGLGATAAAVVAAYALRAQQHAQQRQHDLENLHWLSGRYDALRSLRRRAAKSLLDGPHDEYALREVLNFWESCAFLVREELITVRTLFETIGQVSVPGWWYASGDVIRSLRERVSPSVFEHFEWLKDEIGTGGIDPSKAWIDDFLRREANLPVLGPDATPAALATEAGSSSSGCRRTYATTYGHTGCAWSPRCFRSASASRVISSASPWPRRSGSTSACVSATVSPARR